MIWVTWRGVQIDRIASAWLIRRFIEPEAVFRFIDPYEAPPPGAIPFDIPHTRFSHHGGSATFTALCRHYALNDPVLARIAAIVDAADADGDPLLHPEAVGLDAVCASLVKVVGSDEEAVRVGGLVFDALYSTLKGHQPS